MATPAESPIAGLRSRSSSYSSIDSEYFSKTYIPLTNLPTPPLSSHSSLGSCSQDELFDRFFPPGQLLDPELLGPTIHLINLIPSATSLSTPSIPLVHSILTRAALPLKILAFAVCILDSLNSRFALSWRQGCPLERIFPPSQPPPLQFQPPQSILQQPSTTSISYFSSSSIEATQHVDTIHPELLILGALILAAKFLDDDVCTTLEYAEYWGYGIWSCEQINFTQRCVLENLGYRLLIMWEENIIDGALRDMKRAGKVNCGLAAANACDGDDTVLMNGQVNRSTHMSTGTAVSGLDRQLTPAETPLDENIRGTKDEDTETKAAFSGRVLDSSMENFILQVKGAEPREPFPGLVDLMSGEGVLF